MFQNNALNAFEKGLIKISRDKN